MLDTKPEDIVGGVGGWCIFSEELMIVNQLNPQSFVDLELRTDNDSVLIEDVVHDILSGIDEDFVGDAEGQLSVRVGLGSPDGQAQTKLIAEAEIERRSSNRFQRFEEAFFHPKTMGSPNFIELILEKGFLIRTVFQSAKRISGKKAQIGKSQAESTVSSSLISNTGTNDPLRFFRKTIPGSKSSIR